VARTLVREAWVDGAPALPMTVASGRPVRRLERFEDVRDALRQRDLAQALYDAGSAMMADVLVTLHGPSHQARRRVENRLFRRDVFAFFEQEMAPTAFRRAIKKAAAAGPVDLVPLAHSMMARLSAMSAGIDAHEGSPEEFERLFEGIAHFVNGSIVADAIDEKDDVRDRTSAGFSRFFDDVLRPSIRRREALLNEVAAGTRSAEELPRDVLMTLLMHSNELDLPLDVVGRETAFFFVAGAHTSATALVWIVHHLFEWLAAHPDGRARLVDLEFLQRCAHEGIRLHSSSPIAMRRATKPLTLATGERLEAGDVLVLDLMAANRDPAVFGADADHFDPWRVLPVDVPPYGLSFSQGAHSCIGRHLAAGLLREEAREGQLLYGTITTALAALLDRGVQPDPSRPPEEVSSMTEAHPVPGARTTRRWWASYPVCFAELEGSG
jgi:cytochrome P450